MLPDHYKTLGCSPDASQAQIRDAYKKAALATHPDRFGGSAEATARFQKVSDAYFILSDETRRREYDAEYRSQNPYSDESKYFSSDEERQRKYQEDFMGAFEEMFRDAGMKTPGDESEDSSSSFSAPPPSSSRRSKFYTIVTGAAGTVVGFTIANMPGALAGMAIGAKLGSIRDQKGKSVYAAFQEMPQSDRAKILAELAQRVFASTLSG
ncbi:DnaJ domain-containing protein [Myxozyma melibiosi]|uniref:DnaJ domain-containing protein n=1 Tax=Myxozyma melibiosi TaxID=54550 RepID=A0ABR1FD02_9ASCO